MSNDFPKIIHQIWFNFKNSEEIPEKFSKNIESWKEKNKDWTYKLWDLQSAEFLFYLSGMFFPFIVYINSLNIK